ncbi:hypothetical protein JRQ81_017136, partial [Phrynocephalus forsythii]
VFSYNGPQKGLEKDTNDQHWNELKPNISACPEEDLLLLHGNLNDHVGRWPPLCISPDPLVSQGCSKNLSREPRPDPDSTLVAQTALVCVPPSDVLLLPASDSISGPSLSEPRPDTPSRPSTPTTDRVEDHELIESIILSCCKPSTTKLYHYKWRRFSLYAADKGFDPVNPPLTWPLQYLLHLKRSGLTLSSIRVHLSAIVTHQPPSSAASSFFRHPHLKLFLRGLKNTFPRQETYPSSVVPLSGTQSSTAAAL